MRHRLRARDAWLILVAHIVLYEIACPLGQTYSEEADRWIEAHPVRTRILVLLVALHLINAIPSRVDPIHQLALILKH